MLPGIDTGEGDAGLGDVDLLFGSGLEGENTDLDRAMTLGLLDNGNGALDDLLGGSGDDEEDYGSDNDRDEVDPDDIL